MQQFLILCITGSHRRTDMLSLRLRVLSYRPARIVRLVSPLVFGSWSGNFGAAFAGSLGCTAASVTFLDVHAVHVLVAGITPSLIFRCPQGSHPAAMLSVYVTLATRQHHLRPHHSGCTQQTMR